MLELNKDQISALASLLYEDIANKVNLNNERYVEEILKDKTFNEAYGEFTSSLNKAKALETEADKIRKEAVRSIRTKLLSPNIDRYDSKKSAAYYYGKALGKIKDSLTKKELRDRITLCTIEAQDLETLKQNIIKSF